MLAFNSPHSDMSHLKEHVLMAKSPFHNFPRKRAREAVLRCVSYDVVTTLTTNKETKGGRDGAAAQPH